MPRAHDPEPRSPTPPEDDHTPQEAWLRKMAEDAAIARKFCERERST